MSVGKASIKRAASAGTRKTAAEASKSPAKSAAKAETSAAEVKTSVLTPMDCEEIQVKFLSGKSVSENPNRPVRLTEDMPDFLL